MKACSQEDIMEETIRWDLSNIYPSIDSKQYTAALENTARDIEEFEKTLKGYKPGTLSGKEFEAFAVQVIRHYEAIIDSCTTASAYAYACLTVNTSDKKAVTGVNKADELSVKAEGASVLFHKFIADSKDAVLALTAKGCVLEEYGFVLKETITEAAHMMSPEMENLASDLNRTGCDAFSRLQESISSVASAEIGGEMKTVIQLRTMATDPDRAVRKKAYDAEVSIWKEHEVAFAAALNGVKGSCLTLEKRRLWNDPLEHAAFLSRVNMKVIDALTGTIEKNFPTFRRYLHLKAKALGIKQLAYWDLFAPIGESARKWTYEEAQKFIVEQYTAFNPKQGAFVQNAFDKHWIDPFPRAGKTGGAYDTYMPDVKESRVFANFNYDYDGVFTLSHELGHAWHDRIVSTRPALLRAYPMTLAETASIFGEFTVFKGAVAEASDCEKAILIENYLSSATQTCVDILARFYFERNLFEERAKGELVPSELCEMMVAAQKKAYGDGLDPDTIHPYMWAVKGHYYNAGYSFYNYPYAFGQLFGLGLFKEAQKNGSSHPFCEDLNRMLSITGQYDAMTVAATGGCDIQSPEFWQEGLDIIADYTDQFEELVAKK
jgi:pepF/M3 family oligoendopeptidase